MLLEARMSRTDKDRPYRVRAADPYEPGRYAWHMHTPRYRHRTVPNADGSCDLADFHDRAPTLGWRGRWNNGPNCTWELEHWVFSPWGGSAPHWYRRIRWHGPERARERADLREAAKLFNAGEDIDGFDFPSPQARHCATWEWQ